VHQQLYGTEDLDRIDFGSYARTLCTSLLGSLDPRARIDFDVEPVEVAIDVAVPCGLALNELVTNALKHGRSPDGTCSMRVELRREGEGVLLRVSDEGPGFPSEAVRSTSLGMQLLRSLARQLSAKVEVSRDVGACVTLRMKRPLAPAREAGATRSPIAPAPRPG
jgi:two-component sensor histidine kinase